MKHTILCILSAIAAFGQAQTPFRVYPSAGSSTGAVWLQERRIYPGQNVVKIEAPQSIPADWSMILPSADGTANQCLKTDGSGQLGWVTCDAGGTTAADYDWTQTITAPGAAGTHTITLTPGPLGVVASDTTSQYYIIGTAGANEVVVSTGTGTCDGTGQASCTIEVVTANSHTGTTTIQSATGGGQEHWNVSSAATACPTIRFGSTDYTFRGTVQMNDCGTVESAGARIYAYDTNSPAFSAVYAGSNGRTFYVRGTLSIISQGTHTAGSASILIEGYTDGGVQDTLCFSAYKCVDWYANNSGGGNPISLHNIRSSGTLNAALDIHAAGTGHTAGLIYGIYADGSAAYGIRIRGQSAGWSINQLWFQLINIGVSFEEVSTATVNEMTLSGPCIIDGAQSAAINITSGSSPGTNGLLVHGCFIAMDTGGIPIVASGMERLSIKNNWIRQSGANYAIAATATNYTDISENTINFENSSGTAYGIGLVTTASTDVRISYNIIRRVGGAGSATGLVFQALSYTSVEYCGNRFYGLTTDISDTSVSGVSRCSPLVASLLASSSVLVGTDTDDGTGAKLMTSSANNATVLRNASAVGANIQFQNSGGSTTSPTATQSGDRIGTITLQGMGATVRGNPSVRIRGIAEENFSDTSKAAKLCFETTATTTATSTERMCIAGNGRVGVNVSTPLQRLHVLDTSASPATSGTSQTGIARFAGDATNTLDIGAYSASPFGLWLQGTNVGSLGTTYPLILNPNGGNIGIGMTNPTSTLHVTGTLAVTSTSAFTGNSVFSGSSNTLSGELKPGFDGLGAIGTSSLKYGEVNSYIGRFDGAVTMNSSLTFGSSASVAFASTGSVSFGTSSIRGNNLFFESGNFYDQLYIKSGAALNLQSGSSVTTNSGASGLTVTLSCGSGQALKSITTEDGIVTAATCGAP